MKKWFACWLVATLVLMARPAVAIEVQPTPEQVQAALKEGKEQAQRGGSPDGLYARFGANDDLHPNGFLITKLSALSVMAAHMALRGLDASPPDIAQVLETPTMLVSTVIFGNVPPFAVDSYIVFVQGGKTIKPITVRFDGQANRSAAWPDSPRFKAKVVASFNYADFDPLAKTTIAVFPMSGGEVNFSLDFAEIK